MSSSTPVRLSARLSQRAEQSPARHVDNIESVAHQHSDQLPEQHHKSGKWWRHGFLLASQSYHDDPHEPKCWIRAWMFVFGIHWVFSHPLKASTLTMLPTFVLSILLHQPIVVFPHHVTEFIFFLDVAMIGLAVLSNGIFILETVGGHDSWIYLTLLAFFIRLSYDAYLILTRHGYPKHFHSTVRWLYVLFTNILSVIFFFYTKRFMIIQFWSLPFGYALGFAFYLNKHICLNFHEGLHACVLFCFYLRCYVLPEYI
jgi:hypothetical protein